MAGLFIDSNNHVNQSLSLLPTGRPPIPPATTVKQGKIMIDLKKELSVQNYCFRHFKPQGPSAIARKVRECGLTHCEVTAPTDPALFAETKKAFNDEGVTIGSVSLPVAFSGNPDAERNGLAFAQFCGVKSVMCNFAPQRDFWKPFDVAAKLAEEHGVNLAIHNHGGYHWLGPKPMLAFVFANTSERIGLCLDTAWALDAKMDPIDAVKSFAKRLYGLHFKDFLYSPARQPQDVIVGEGNINLPALIAALKEIDYNGYAALEFEGDVENPVPKLRKCVEAVYAAC
jgi:sugar phosphate isomerase/epimerase